MKTRTPDIRFDVFLSEIGYQLDIYLRGVLLSSGCRDYSEDQNPEDLAEEIAKKIREALLYDDNGKRR